MCSKKPALLLYCTDAVPLVPILTKKKLVEKYLNLKRYREEENILLKEMTSVLSFSRDFMQSLTARKISLELILKNKDAYEEGLAEDCTTYQSSSRKSNFVQGKLSLIKEALHASKHQTRMYADTFSMTTSLQFKDNDDDDDDVDDVDDDVDDDDDDDDDDDNSISDVNLNLDEINLQPVSVNTDQWLEELGLFTNI